MDQRWENIDGAGQGASFRRRHCHRRRDRECNCNPQVLMRIDDDGSCTNTKAAQDTAVSPQEADQANAIASQGNDQEVERSQCSTRTQFHVHEVIGSVEIAEAGEDPHNHRFATVSGEARSIGNNDHVHDVRFRTDYYENHFHEAWGRTGRAVQVGDKHVHYLEAATTLSDGHMHRYAVVTLEENPIGG